MGAQGSNLGWIGGSLCLPALWCGMTRRAAWSVLVPAFFIGSLASADTIHPGSANAGFELGNLTNWTATLSETIGNSPGGSATVLSTTLSLDGIRYDGFVTWVPVEGTKFALLRGSHTGIYQKLSTVFTAAAGDRVAFNVFFDITEERAYLPAYNDDGYAKLVNMTTLAETVLFASSVASLPNRGNSGWSNVDFAIPAAGIYRLEFGVRNMTDHANAPQMGIDTVAIPAPPTTPSVALARGTVGEIRVQFTAQAGLGYTIQYKNALADSAWSNLADIAPASGSQAVDHYDATTAGIPQRFYRVVTPQVP